MLHAIESDTTIPARPYAFIIRTTERCEVGCDHCCINATPKGADMDFPLAEQVFREAKAAGVGLIHLSGGEPLLHHQLEDFVKVAADNGLYVEVTTSTYSTAGDRPVSRVAALKAAGLKRVMVSYDASHAQRVPIDQYAEFVREAQQADLEVCACVVEWNGSPWPLERVRSECEVRGVNGEIVDWCRTQLSLAGRAGRRYAEQVTPIEKGARCPYVLTAPTLAPDGTVYLCPNLQSRSALFQLGNVKERTLPEILDNLQSSRFYRSLSLLGPHGVAEVLGLPADEIPTDMCGCCRKVLKAAEDKKVYAQVENEIPDDDTPVPLDINALLPGHQRFVRGEERPEKGCMCG